MIENILLIKSNLTLDVLVVSTVSGLLTEVEALLLAGHKWTDGDTILFTHHTLGRGLVDLKSRYFSHNILFFVTDRSAACVVEEALRRLAPHGWVKLIEVAARVILAQPAAAPAILIMLM